MLIIGGGIGTIYEVIATTGIIAAKRDAWLTVPLAYVIGTIIGIYMIKLGLLFPDKTIVQYLPIILGKFIGKIIGLIYILIIFFTTALLIRANLDTFALVMPLTPKIAMSILLTILVVYASICGFEVFARVIEFFMPIVISIILMIILLNISDINLRNLSPILENGISPLIKSIPTQSAFAFETVLFLGMWFPCLTIKNKGMKMLSIGMCICMLVLTLLTIGIIGFYGTEFASIYNFNFFQMSRYILLGEFFSGLDVLSILIWLVTAFIQIEVFFYPTVIGIAQWLNLKNYKSLIFPVAVISVALSFIPPNVIVVHNYDFNKNVYAIFPFGLSIPIIYLIAVLRKFRKA